MTSPSEEPAASKGAPQEIAHGSRRAAFAFVLFAGAAFATSGPLARYARPCDPLLLAAGRVAIAGVALALLDLRQVIASLRALSPRHRAGVLGAGAILGAHFALFLCGLDRTTFAAAMTLVSLEPMSVVLTAWIWFRVRPSRMEQAGVALATAGAVLVGRAAGDGEHRVLGDLLVVGAVALYGVYVAAARGLRHVIAPRAYAALVYSAAAVTLGVVLPWLPIAEGTTRDPPAHAWIAMIAMGLVPTVLGHTAVQTAARTLPPTTVALVSPMETVGAIVIGVAAFGTAPKPLEWAGAAVILAGSLLAIFGVRSQPASTGSSDAA